VERLIVAAMNELCRINIADREYASAEANVSSIWKHKKVHDDADSIPVYLTIAKLEYAQNRLDRSEEMLRVALKLAVRYGEIFQRFLASMELSKVLYQKLDLAKSFELLRAALEISRQKGYEYLLLRALQRDEWMLDAIREQDIEKSYVMGIIKKSKIDVHWIEARIFGVPSLRIDDQAVSDDAWKTLKAKKLLFYMLLQKGERTSGDLLVDKLWPGVTFHKGSDSLRKAIQHIREIAKSVGGATVELLTSAKGVYQIPANIYVYLDSDEFERLHQEAVAASSDEVKEGLFKKAIDLYGEGFAIGWYEDWIEERRRYLQGRYEECLAALAGVFSRKADYERALDSMEKLLALNFLDEQYHRQYMGILAKMDRCADIQSDFERLRETLKKEMKVDPQKETVDLYRTLVNAGTGH
jgi:DNA-binding SARP family transcriptional activator